MIEVLVADDHAFFRASVVDVLDSAADTTVVAECRGGAEVLPAFRRHRPDVLLLDLAMPGVTGLEAAREVLAVDASARVVMLTGDASPGSVREARRIGVAGYLLKDDDPTLLAARVRAVAEGGVAWSAGVHALGEASAD
ncbi:response regulator [Geodermatophilus sp. FMUSA9-8]|uniref:response regulator n=1 Tax=Geodermatophilus sp. FMUSA9-8 TaxID=3120155 RepID=UPI00300A25E2